MGGGLGVCETRQATPLSSRMGAANARIARSETGNPVEIVRGCLLTRGTSDGRKSCSGNGVQALRSAFIRVPCWMRAEQQRAGVGISWYSANPGIDMGSELW